MKLTENMKTTLIHLFVEKEGLLDNLHVSTYTALKKRDLVEKKEGFVYYNRNGQRFQDFLIKLTKKGEDLAQKFVLAQWEQKDFTYLPDQMVPPEVLHLYIMNVYEEVLFHEDHSLTDDETSRYFESLRTRKNYILCDFHFSYIAHMTPKWTECYKKVFELGKASQVPILKSLCGYAFLSPKRDFYTSTRVGERIFFLYKAHKTIGDRIFSMRRKEYEAIFQPTEAEMLRIPE